MMGVSGLREREGFALSSIVFGVGECGDVSCCGGRTMAGSSILLSVLLCVGT